MYALLFAQVHFELCTKFKRGLPYVMARFDPRAAQ